MQIEALLRANRFCETEMVLMYSHVMIILPANMSCMTVLVIPAFRLHDKDFEWQTLNINWITFQI